MYSLQGGVEKVAQEDRPGVRTEQKVKVKRTAGPALRRGSAQSYLHMAWEGREEIHSCAHTPDTHRPDTLIVKGGRIGVSALTSHTAHAS